MANECFYQSKGKALGPFSPVELQRLAAHGVIDGDTLVRRGDGPWIPASRVKSLIPARPAHTTPAEPASAPPATQSTPQATAQAASPPLSSQEAPPGGPPAAPAQVSAGPRGPGYALGIGAIVLGLVGLVTAWFPLVSLCVLGLGLVLGVAGLLLAAMRKTPGIGLSIAGTVLCTLVLVPTAGFWFLVRPAIERSAETLMRQVLASQAALNPAQPPTSAESPSPAPESAGPESSEPEWVDATTGGVTENQVEVRVSTVRLGAVKAEAIVHELLPQSSARCLQITLSIRNRSKSRKLEYSTWSGANPLASLDALVTGALRPAGDTATLTDNFGNGYKVVNFGLGTQVPGQQTTASIYPGKTLADLLVFEVPVDNFQYVNLELPAANIGGKEPLRLRVPRSMVKGL